MLDARKLNKGEEHYEEFYSANAKKMMIQFEYRSISGKLYSTVAKDLETCKAKIQERMEKDGVTK